MKRNTCQIGASRRETNRKEAVSNKKTCIERNDDVQLASSSDVGLAERTDEGLNETKYRTLMSLLNEERSSNETTRNHTSNRVDNLDGFPITPDHNIVSCLDCIDFELRSVFIESLLEVRFQLFIV